jgi:hypothetical protein
MVGKVIASRYKAVSVFEFHGFIPVIASHKKLGSIAGPKSGYGRQVPRFHKYFKCQRRIQGDEDVGLHILYSQY